MLMPGPGLAQQPALPQGGQVVEGNATVTTPSGTTLNITQDSLRAIIDWKDFSIGAGGRVDVHQPGAAAALLNRVTGGNLSLIDGQLNANGKVYLINPQGITVGPNGVIDTAAFVGSTLNTSNSAFMAGGALGFAGDAAAGVINLGTITTSSGDVVIIAPRIANQGRIEAPAGTAALLSGREVVYAPTGPGSLVIKAPVSSEGAAAIDNAGSIRAAEVVLKAAGSPYALAVNNGGAISATTVTHSGGRIILDGGRGNTTNSGSLTATGAAGGAIDVLGANIELTGGVLDASGAAGGGEIRIGGGFRGQDASVANAATTTVGADVAIRANATANGDGGSVVAWSDGTTIFRGSIEARGGSTGGNGGQAEVSGHELTYLGRTDLSAPAGTTGTLLLDPGSLVIDAAAATTIQNDLNAANVTLDGYDDITVSAGIANNTTTNTLTLDAPVIAVNQSISLTAGDIQFGDGSAGTSLTSASGASISAFTITVRNGFQTINFAGPLVAPSNGLSVNMTAGSPGSFTATNTANQLKNLYMNTTNLSGAFDLRSSVAMKMSGKLTAGGNVTMVASSGDLAFDAGGCGPATEVSSSGTTTLASTAGAFNGNGNLTLSGSGRKRIYSSTTSGNFNVTGVSYTQYTGVSYPNDPQSGNVVYIAAGSALPTLTITANNQSIRYGDGDPAYTASFSGGSESDLTSPVKFSVSGAHRNVGTYTITPFGAASSNYQLTYVNGTLTVVPAPLTITAPTFSTPYGTTMPAFTPTYNGFRNSDGPEVVSGLGISVNARQGSPVGVYPIVLSGGSASNYTITLVNGALTITPAVLRVIANNTSRLFGASNPVFGVSYSGLVNGDTAAAVSGVTVSTEATERSDVGTYAITPSGGVAANYQIEHVPGTLTITPAPLTASTSSANVTYGEPLPALNTTVTGLVAGDTFASLGITHATTARQGTGVGVYPTTLGGNLSNYQVSYSPGSYTINPRSLTIAVNPVRRTQFAPNPTFTTTITGLFGSDQVSGLVLSTTAALDSPAGAYAIVPTADPDSNYLMFFVPGFLTVDPVPPVQTELIVTMDGTFDPGSLPTFTMPAPSGISVVSTNTGLSGLVFNAGSVVAEALQPLGDVNRYLYLMRNPGSADSAEVGKVLPFLVDRAKVILDRDPGTWSAEEASFIEYMTSTISAQRKSAAEQAAKDVEAWKLEQKLNAEKQGAIALVSTTERPPDRFLEQAQTGVQVNDGNVAAFTSLLAAAASLDANNNDTSGATGAIVAGTVATGVIGAAAAGFSTVALTVGIKVGSIAGVSGAPMIVGNAAGFSAGFAAGAAVAVVAVVVAMVAAAVKAGIEVADAIEYDNDLARAVAAAQTPTTAADLKSMLSTADGQKQAFFYLTAQAANSQSGGK